jgi:dUTP pyrophosphatase
MKVKVKRIDLSLPLPQYHTEGSVCFDLLARIAMEIAPKSLGLIPTNIIIETPPGYMFMVVPRSSTPKKKGLLIPHGLGIIDQDYSGPNDEVLFQVYNFTDTVVKIEKGERLAQGGFVRMDKAEFDEVEVVSEKSRGGFGSTGN